MPGFFGAALVTFLALFPLVNPFGAIPLFASLTEGGVRAERRIAALKIALYVIAILIVFFLIGRYLLEFFGISLPVIRIAGGLLVGNAAWGMATGASRISPDETRQAHAPDDSFTFSPMAMPMLAGPGAIGEVMGIAAATTGIDDNAGSLAGIVAIGGLTFVLLTLAGTLILRLGPRAIGAMNRIFGFLILAIAVQLITNGLSELHLFK
jgi:multiple antibiotic resistance protein